jgi:predicted O-linked N-acetylglucosamine transferase (SPINDLY family)
VNSSFTAADAARHGLPHHFAGVILANFNHLQKLGPATFRLWTSILKARPAARRGAGASAAPLLWVLRFPAEAEAHLRREAAAAGVEAEQVLPRDVGVARWGRIRGR